MVKRSRTFVATLFVGTICACVPSEDEPPVPPVPRNWSISQTEVYVGDVVSLRGDSFGKRNSKSAVLLQTDGVWEDDPAAEIVSWTDTEIQFRVSACFKSGTSTTRVKVEDSYFRVSLDKLRVFCKVDGSWAKFSQGAAYGFSWGDPLDVWENYAIDSSGRLHRVVFGSAELIDEGPWSEVAAAWDEGHYACGIKKDGTLWCWGVAREGRTAHPETVEFPKQVSTAADWASISLADITACGLRTDGELYCWGSNTRNQAGHQDKERIFMEPTQVLVSEPLQTLELNSLGCALSYSYTVYCWGTAGIFNVVRIASPMQMKPEAMRWSNISLNNMEVCALSDEDGSLWCSSFDFDQPESILNLDQLDRRAWAGLSLSALVLGLEPLACLLSRAGQWWCSEPSVSWRDTLRDESLDFIGAGHVWKEIKLYNSHRCAINDQQELYCSYHDRLW